MPSSEEKKPARFGEKLRTLRKRRNMTLVELSQLLGYTAHVHVSNMERGKRFPSLEIVVTIADIFDVTTDQLLRDELDV